MAADGKGIWKTRAGLVALFTLFFVPVIASLVLVITKPGWTPFGTVNRGELIVPPPRLPLMRARAVSHEAPLFELASGKWAFVHLSGGRCSQPCAQALVSIRQARIALGREADRVVRVWLMTGDVAPVRMREVLEGFPGLHAYHASDELASLFPRPADDAVYVIDPVGLLILRYEGEESASDVLKDMKRLLKISKQG